VPASDIRQRLSRYEAALLVGMTAPAIQIPSKFDGHFDQQYGRPLGRTLMIEDLGQALRSETMNAVRSPCVAACP
jgi:hypothetical protein